MITVETLTAGRQTEMETQKSITVVTQCIDFRKVEQGKALLQSQENLSDGDYYLLSTAGASMNNDASNRLGLQQDEKGSLELAINLNHLDCGYAKNVTKDDSPKAHEEAMDKSGQQLSRINSGIQYRTHLLPYIDKVDDRHECIAVAIILGKPNIVNAARKKLAQLGFTGNHDEIARPFELSIDDRSIWDDLKISFDLHHPKEVRIYDEGQKNATILGEEVERIAKETNLEVKVIAEPVPVTI